MKKQTIDNRAPKILPVLAHRAGIAPERVEALWQQALDIARCTQEQSDALPDHKFWQHALACWHGLIADEARRADLASFGWRPWARVNAQYWQWRTALFASYAERCERNWRTLAFCLPPAQLLETA